MSDKRYCDMCDTVTNHPLAGCPGKPPSSLVPAVGSAPQRTIANEIADYRATPQAAKDLLNKVVSKLIDLRCPHCGGAVNVTIET